MTFINTPNFSHEQSDKVGLLITNLGTPDAPTSSALRRYLRQFLSDPRVVEFPRLLWKIVLHGIILNVRPARSAKAYQRVWTDEGSPLSIYTAKQAELLRKRLGEHWGKDLVIEWGMRYGNPSISDTIQRMTDQGVRKLLVLPLYPQYSGSTTASTFDAIAHDFTQRRWLPELRFINSYHDFPAYIDALAKSIQQHWQTHGRAQKLIFSYHGIPLRYLHNGDPYHCHCHKTSRLLASSLELKDDEYLTTFQSRFGREPWLQPYTDETMEALPSQGVQRVQVVCPGFSSDCLETIEEIDMENRDYFLKAGGESFEYIPALNDQAVHIEALAELVEHHLQGWHEKDPSWTALRQSLYQEAKYNRKPSE